MKTRLGLAGAAAATALIATVAVRAPASAAIQDCPSNRACGWFNANYQGSMGAWASSSYSLPGFNDNISSMLNKRSTSIRWFYDVGYTGTSWPQGPGEGGYFQWPDWRNDQFSSLFIYSY